MKNNFLNLKDIHLNDLRAILSEALRIKDLRVNCLNGKKDEDKVLSDVITALIFEKPSTRTRFSFDVGIRQLGGQTITSSSADMHLGKNENVSDTAKVLSRYVDLVMLRTFDEKILFEFCEHSAVPVINGLTDQSHPCQVLADIFTYEEKRGSISGKKVTWAGDGNNVCNSYLEAAGKFGFNFCFYGPQVCLPDRNLIESAEKCGGKVLVTEDPEEAFYNADLVVTDTWVSMHEIEKKQKRELFSAFQVTSKKMSLAKKDSIFLHCLPAHRGEEVTDEVIDGPNSQVFEAAENRLHVQKAIIKWVLEI